MDSFCFFRADLERGSSSMPVVVVVVVVSRGASIVVVVLAVVFEIPVGLLMTIAAK